MRKRLVFGSLVLLFVSPSIGYSEGFFPVHKDNIWIYSSYSHGYGPPSRDTTACTLSSRILDGEQYWLFSLSILPPGEPFRVDEEGNLWFRMREEGADAISRFRQWLDEYPELKESQYYQQSPLFKDLHPEQKDLLVYDFDGVMPDPGSPTFESDRLLGGIYFEELQYVFGEMIMKRGEPSPNRRIFFFGGGTSEWSGEMVFEEGIGVVRVRTLFRDGNEEETDLLWTRVNGKEWGQHPGPGYPGYETPVENETWGKLKLGLTTSP